MGLYLFDRFVPWWAAFLILFAALVLCAGVLGWYYRPTIEWTR